MAGYVGGSPAVLQLPIDYSFDFHIEKDYTIAASPDVVSDLFTHRQYDCEDVWQLKLSKTDRHGYFHCQLHLISTNQPGFKTVRVPKLGELGPYRVGEIPHWRQSRLNEFSSARSPIEFHPKVILIKKGDQFNVGIFQIDRSLVKLRIQVLKCDSAYPSGPTTYTIHIPKSTLPAEVFTWFQTEEFGDVTILANDGKKFNCHRDVLTRRSEVFSQMFSAGMKEERENIVDMQQFDGEIVSSLLQFLYIDECGDIRSIADQLYITADLYKLDRLKILCEYALATNLSEEYVVKTKKLAELYHLDKLMAMCVSLESAINQPIGNITITSVAAKDDSDKTQDRLPVDQFSFVVNQWVEWPVWPNITAVEETFQHNGDRWEFVVVNNSDRSVSCQLHLVKNATDTPKLAVCSTLCDLYDNMGNLVEDQGDYRTQMALFRPNDDSASFGFNISYEAVVDEMPIRFDVQLVKFEECVAVPSEPEPLKSQFSTELLKWFQSEDFGNATVVAADGKIFRCHREILAARSEVFKLKFNSSVANLINVEDFNGEIVSQLLVFIYTDECEVGPTADCLFAAADHYKLERLGKMCQSAMATSLSAETVVKTYRLATFNHLDELLAVCDRYLDDHKAKMSIGKLLAESIKLERGNEGQVEQK